MVDAMRNKTQFGAVAALIAVMLKGSKLIALFKTVKLLKVLLSMGTMLLSVILYGFTLGIWFSIGLVTMLFIHEMGHVIAMKRRGISCSLPIFIPFLGAAIFAPKMGDRATEAYAGYGGPLLGSAGALGCFAWWWLDGGTSDLLLTVSYLGTALNLFNLIPVSPFDGGRVLQAVSQEFKYLGAALGLILVVLSRQPGLVMLLILMLDSFPLMRRQRACLSVFLACGMVGFILAGFGDADLWINVLDATFGCVFTVLHVLNAWAMPDHEVIDSRLMPSARIRFGWLAAYLALAVVLVGTVAIQVRLMPNHVTHTYG